MASKSAKNTKKNGKTLSNASSSKKDTPTSVPLALSAVVLIVAFLAGVLTPPLRHSIGELLVDRRLETANNESNSAVSNNFPHVPCTPTNLDNYLHSAPINGLHIICIESLNLDADGNELPSKSQTPSHKLRLEQSNSIRLTFYKQSYSGRFKRRTSINGSHKRVSRVQDLKWADVHHHIITELDLKPAGTMKQPWAVFSALGERIIGEDSNINEPGFDEQVIRQLTSSEMVILTEGGNWIWPGVAEGFRRTVEVSTPKFDKARTVTIETLSLQPLVVSIEGFLDDDECEYIQRIAGPRVQYSQVSLMDKDKGKAASEWRTSQSTFMSARNDPILTEIDDRVASLTRIPKSHGEHVQVLRYGHNEKYDCHHDYFNPNLYKTDHGTLNLIQNGKRNRFATVFWYLTDVDDGGETIFPRHGGAPQPYDLSSCEVGLKVKPQKGKVIIFYSLDAAGNLDDLSLHGACRVGEGNVKWAANKWIWNAPMGYVSE